LELKFAASQELVSIRFNENDLNIKNSAAKGRLSTRL